MTTNALANAFIDPSFASFSLLSFTEPVLGYVGPGAGLLAIAAFIALAIAVLAALVGFLWFPLKRLMNKKNSPKTKDSETIQE